MKLFLLAVDFFGYRVQIGNDWENFSALSASLHHRRAFGWVEEKNCREKRFLGHKFSIWRVFWRFSVEEVDSARRTLIVSFCPSVLQLFILFPSYLSQPLRSPKRSTNSYFFAARTQTRDKIWAMSVSFLLSCRKKSRFSLSNLHGRLHLVNSVIYENYHNQQEFPSVAQKSERKLLINFYRRKFSFQSDSNFSLSLLLACFRVLASTLGSPSATD